MDSPLEWREVSGKGHIWSIISPHPPLTPQFSSLAPYNAVVVALKEDPRVRLVGNLVASADSEINSVQLAEASIGDRVRVVMQRVDDTLSMPRWQLMDN